MKNKKQFTLIELIIVIVVIGILAAMALPKFNGVVRDAKLAAMINDKEVLEKSLILYYQKYDELPLLNEDQELVIANEGISLSKIVLAEEVKSRDMDTIYKSLKETLTYYSDSEETLYRIDLPKIKDNLSKDIKYGHKKHDKDFYVYSTKTGNVYYYDYLVNGDGTIQHTEYDTLLKNNELVTKAKSPSIKGEESKKDNVPILLETNNIAVGDYHSMKIGEDGNLYAWGKNNFGQLGIGNTTNQLNAQKVILPNGIKPKSIYSGESHSMAIGYDGCLYAWGLNTDGQLGIGNTINQLTPQMVELPDGAKPISISLGERYSFVLGDNGKLYVFGLNYNSQLGLGNSINQLKPQELKLPNDVKAIYISTGFYHSMIIGSDGNVYAWGRNQYGQLGLGNTTDQQSPKLVSLPNGLKPVSISLGKFHSLLLFEDGSVYSCGSNEYGQLGFNNLINKNVFTKKSTSMKVTKIQSGEYHSLLLYENYSMFSFGNNSVGQLGLGNTSTLSMGTINSFAKPKSIFVGTNSTICEDINGYFYVWGYNLNGQLGLGNTNDQTSPVKTTLFN